MNRTAVAGICLLLLGIAPPATAQADTFTIVDRQGFAAPLPAVTFRVPSGWKARGSIRWSKPCSYETLFAKLFRANSADGRIGLRLSPGFVFDAMGADPPGADPVVDNMVADYMRQQRAANAKSNCVAQAAGDLRWLAERLVVARRPAGTKLVSVTSNKEAAEKLKQSLGGLVRVDPRDTFTVEVAVVRVEYGSALGPVEEDVALQVIRQRSYTPPFNGVSTYNDNTSVFPLVRFWAPRGQLDRATPVLLRILASGKTESRWGGEVENIRAKNRQARRQESEARSKRWHEEQERQSERTRTFIDAVIWGSALQMLSQGKAQQGEVAQ